MTMCKTSLLSFRSTSKTAKCLCPARTPPHFHVGAGSPDIFLSRCHSSPLDLAPGIGGECCYSPLGIPFWKFSKSHFCVWPLRAFILWDIFREAEHFYCAETSMKTLELQFSTWKGSVHCSVHEFKLLCILQDFDVHGHKNSFPNALDIWKTDRAFVILNGHMYSFETPFLH